MKLRPALMLLASGVCLMGCAQEGGITTGSILQSLPSASSLIPSASSIVPSLTVHEGPRKAEKVGSNLYRVFASDRKIDDSIQRENYALLRAAETAKSVGGTHFIIVNAGDQASSGITGTGNGPELSALIRVLRLEPGAETPIGSVAADEIIHFFGPAFGRTVDTPAAQAPPAAPAPAARPPA